MPKPYYSDNHGVLYHGDCLEVLKTLPDNSVDSVVTDPPAGISFMGKDWDHDRGGRDNWIAWMTEVAKECLRVLKPGGHAFVWSIPRTSHWTGMAWENAGFKPRDVVAHVFGSGFPKSANIGKFVDKLHGNERELLSITVRTTHKKGTSYEWAGGNDTGICEYTKGTSEWEGWGTALKPAREDWWLLRKPLDKGLTIAENCLKWGTGGINIDGSRVGAEEISTHNAPKGTFAGGEQDRGSDTESYRNHQGRFPANLIHDNSEEVRECFPESGNGKFSKGSVRKTLSENNGFNLGFLDGNSVGNAPDNYGDSGNASRFFKSIIYTAKASKSERNRGCEELEDKFRAGLSGADRDTDEPLDDVSERFRTQPAKNNHPTVKPIALMEYLINMITPKGGVVLDPFMGSGSTGVACKNLKREFIGIEKEAEYIKIAEARIAGTPERLF